MITWRDTTETRALTWCGLAQHNATIGRSGFVLGRQRIVGPWIAHTASLIIGLWSARRCTTSKPIRSNVDARPVYTTESDFVSSVSHG